MATASPSTAPTPSLQLEPRRTVVRAGGTGEPVLLELKIGWQDLEAAFGASLSEAAIEMSIERVEDALGHPGVGMPQVLRIHGDETLRRMAEAAGLQGSPDISLSAQAVEALFSRLATQAAGALPRADRLPEDARFGATLVIVRELMHHLHIHTLRLDSP